MVNLERKTYVCPYYTPDLDSVSYRGDCSLRNTRIDNVDYRYHCYGYTTQDLEPDRIEYSPSHWCERCSYFKNAWDLENKKRKERGLSPLGYEDNNVGCW